MSKSIGFQGISKRRIQNKNKHYWVQSGSVRKDSLICHICGTTRIRETGKSSYLYKLVTGEETQTSPECKPREY